MLDLLGCDYVIDHCITQFQRDQERKSAIVYITDSLKILNENVVRIHCGSTMTMRWIDTIDAQNEPEPEKNATEIITNIKEKLRQMGGKAE